VCDDALAFLQRPAGAGFSDWIACSVRTLQKRQRVIAHDRQAAALLGQSEPPVRGPDHVGSNSTTTFRQTANGDGRLSSAPPRPVQLQYPARTGNSSSGTIICC